MELLYLDIISSIGYIAGPQTYGNLILTCMNFSLLAKNPHRLNAIKKLELTYQFHVYDYEWIDVPIASSFDELLYELYANYINHIKKNTRGYLHLCLFKPIDSNKKTLCRVMDAEYRFALYYLNDVPEFNDQIVKFNRRKCDYEYLEPYQISVFNEINIERQHEFAQDDDDNFEKAFDITKNQYEEITIMDIDFSSFKSMLTIMYFHTDEYAGTFLDIKKFTLRQPNKYSRWNT